MPSEPQLEVLVLGPLAVRLNGVAIAVDRPLERALLVRLALANGLPVPDQRLAVDLWGDVDLARPTERLRVLASRLRAALGTPDVLTRASNGYALSAQMTDLVGARSLAKGLYAAARAGDHATVSALGREALALWRGASLADLRAVPYAATEAEQLDTWRLDLQVERLDAELALGGATEAGRELEGLAAEHPLHERLSCLLALALYRTGRQADALNRLARLRSRLADDLGVDPAPETAEMELRLLRQDPALLLPQVGSEELVVAQPSAASTLPLPMTTFVGRQAELGDLVRRLGSPGLITLTGGPGSGKSRLALEAAAASGRAVRLVQLAPLDRVDAVLAALAGEDADSNHLVDGDLDAVTAALGGALVVLDNAEHVVESVAEVVAGLLRRKPGLTILVTSQRPLQLGEEELRPMDPLDGVAAAQLFTERCAADAQGADPQLVAAICTAVDRLPLGIELAAGLTRTLTVPQLADRMRPLVAGSKDPHLIAGPRDPHLSMIAASTDPHTNLVAGSRDPHPSLIAALDWSHQLLGEAERAVLRRVAVFADGFTLEAAEQVAVDPRDVAPALTELADRSLLTVEAVGGRRFRMLETVRDYALGKFAETGEVETLATLYLHTGQAEQARTAYESCVAADRVAGDEQGLSRGLGNLAGALVALGRLDEALEAVAESDHCARQFDDRQLLSVNDGIRGAVAAARGEYADAEKHLRAAVDHGAGITMAHLDLADVLIRQGELIEAASLLDAVFAGSPVNSTTWLAARAIATALAHAQQDVPLTAQLLSETLTAYETSSFAWPRYTDRLLAVRDALQR
ncbi:AfsR/SARP family transcriptional regulator [Kribbella italica]|uniref:Putative ATPase/DNA-binding SARP family transcriptional activator n=1 Tax=Kribbella italica TaxID=1540520 RepID=A0A7W9J7B5_9ACTN|nr:BTAD domain-containing putative transcriptional regulator [Kribbella italica]MBB5836705.1 putative ATPase/DNA-binding SARP family transcriptional activator [Kribbella italica]